MRNYLRWSLLATLCWWLILLPKHYYLFSVVTRPAQELVFKCNDQLFGVLPYREDSSGMYLLLLVAPVLGFLFGLIALFKVLNSFFPNKKWAILFGIFLLPSTLFWCSGIHKDGIVFLSLMLVVYNVYFGIKNHLTFKRIVFIVTGKIHKTVLRQTVYLT